NLRNHARLKNNDPPTNAQGHGESLDFARDGELVEPRSRPPHCRADERRMCGARTMNLYILRHALAADKADWKGSDSDRPLTKDGIRKMKKVGKGMRRLDMTVDWILTSPHRRAYDTAVIAAKALKLKNRLKTSRMLAPDGDMKALIRHLALNFRSWESVLLVGHEPYLGSLMGILVAGNATAGTLLDKAGLAKLSADSFTNGQCAQLEWLLSPNILKKLA